MEAITELTKLDITSVFLGLFIILCAIIAIYEIICKILDIFQKPVGVYKRREEDHKLVVENTKTVKELAAKQEEDKRQSILHDKRIEDKLEKLTLLFVKKEINDMRWELLDFCSAVSGGRQYNREAYSHIFSIYEEYEKILNENGMENGFVNESMKFVREKYQELLRSGEI